MDFLVWVLFLDGVADGLDQVSLAEPGSAVNEKWIVLGAGAVYDRLGGSVS